MLREAIGLFLSMALVALAILACGDPVWNMTGTVVDGTGAPVPGATVTVVCPGRATPAGVQVTNDAGAIEMGGIPSIQSTCTADITKAGKTPKTVPVTAFCFRSTSAGNASTPCAPTEGKVTLP